MGTLFDFFERIREKIAIGENLQPGDDMGSMQGEVTDMLGWAVSHSDGAKAMFKRMRAHLQEI